MNKLDGFLTWLRDPFGYKRLHKRHQDVQKNMVAATSMTESAQRRLQREQRRKIRARRANDIERAVLGQYQRSSS